MSTIPMKFSWRDGLCKIVEVQLDENGHIDLAHLERLLQLPEIPKIEEE